MLPINYVAVIVAAIVCFIIGFLFHGPVFGKLWMKLAHIDPMGNEKLSDMAPQMFKNFLANLVCAYFLAVFYLFASTSAIINGASGVLNGMFYAFLIWLGFVVTSSSIDVIWMGKSKNLWYFEIIASLVSFLAMGAIIAVW